MGRGHEVGTLGDTPAERSAYDRIYSVIGDCDAISLDRYLAEYRQAILQSVGGARPNEGGPTNE